MELVTFRLDDLERIESTEVRVGSSSRRDACGVATGVVDTDPGTEILLSERPWVDLLGGGGGFLDACEGGGGVAVVGLGGVGGRAVGAFAVSWLNSGTFPAASRSNGLSRSSSPGDLTGGGGRGLLTSEGCSENGEAKTRESRAEEDAGLGVPGVPDLSSPLSSTLINFPCLELGGGGGGALVLEDVDV